MTTRNRAAAQRGGERGTDEGTGPPQVVSQEVGADRMVPDADRDDSTVSDAVAHVEDPPPNAPPTRPLPQPSPCRQS